MLPNRSPNQAADSAHQPIIIWGLRDNRAGHRHQIEGLVRQLNERKATIVHWINIDESRKWASLRDWICGHFPLGQKLPAPQLIIGAGHSTHLAALAARRAYGGKAVILMRPTLPTRLFDLCLVPEHDLESAFSRIDRCRVIPTRGVLNPFVPSRSADSSRALILLGGPSRHHGWSDDDVVEQLSQLIRLSPTRLTWTVTTSRRTPSAFVERLTHTLRAEPGGPTVHIVPYTQTPPDWLSQQLTESGTVFVSEDSVSMVFEALTVGADVGLIQVPRRDRHSRNARCIDRIVAARLVIPFEEWQQTRFEQRQRETFNEAARCAEIVCRQLLDAA